MFYFWQIIIFPFLSMIFAILGCSLIHELIHLLIYELMNSILKTCLLSGYYVLDNCAMC